MKPNATIGICGRLKLAVRGAVQGVGFRPFVFRLATELDLRGWVTNSPQGVFIEVEGKRPALEHFLLRLVRDKPPRSFIQSLESSWLDAVGYSAFQIRTSTTGGGKTALILPDIATCPDCLRDIRDPLNRRHQYPFTNCTNCGPRFSILNALPYDRAQTTMKSFRMCPACQAEYDNPRDRRFHAQPNACPECGPQLELWPGVSTTWPRPGCGWDGEFEPPRRLAHQYDAVLLTAHVLRCGQIVAVKGIGGYHLMADARSEKAVGRLRERKQREEKPFALMFPSLASVNAVCEVSPLEERLLVSPEAPIVLLRRIANGSSLIADLVAPGNPNLGVMLPANPIHHLLMAELGFPVVATSGNLSDEPICIDNQEALERLSGIADVFLVHNRPIVRPIDDSIVRVMLDREMVLRRARGYAPLPIPTADAEAGGQNILAVGAHLKNAVAMAVGDQVFLSQHIGDLASQPAHNAFRRATADLPQLYDARPEVIAADLHPDYLSTRFAMEHSRRQPQPSAAPAMPGTTKATTRSAVAAKEDNGTPRLFQVQHHIAHVLSCIAENEVALPALGVAWDGTGYGFDGTIWGGEFFHVTPENVERIAHLRSFALPGGDAAIREPRRTALGLLQELAGSPQNDRVQQRQILAPAFSPAELATLEAMLERNVNSPRCSSIGRLFDAVAALVLRREQTQFEGQAAMELEFALDGLATDEAYSLPLVTGPSSWILDWALMIEALLKDLGQGLTVSRISAKFHNALVEAIVTVAKECGEQRVVLSGGCFQNRYLTERTIRRLQAEGFQPYWHQRVPPNDGGIALGQIMAARRAPAGRCAALPPPHPPEAEPLLVADDAWLTTLTPDEARTPAAQVTHHVSR